MRAFLSLVLVVSLGIITGSAEAAAGARALREQAKAAEAKVTQGKYAKYEKALAAYSASSVTRWDQDTLVDLRFIYPSGRRVVNRHREIYTTIFHGTTAQPFISNVIVYRALYPLANDADSLDAFFDGINVSEDGYYRYAGALYMRNYRPGSRGDSTLLGQFAREYRYTGETAEYQPYMGTMIITAKNGYVYVMVLQASPAHFDREYALFRTMTEALVLQAKSSSSSSRQAATRVRKSQSSSSAKSR